jgi:hypothetical protein
MSRPALGPTQPPVQWVPGALSPGVKRGRGVMLTTHPYLVGAIPPLPPSASMACRGTALLFKPTMQNFRIYYIGTGSEICSQYSRHLKLTKPMTRHQPIHEQYGDRTAVFKLGKCTVNVGTAPALTSWNLLRTRKAESGQGLSTFGQERPQEKRRIT